MLRILVFMFLLAGCSSHKKVAKQLSEGGLHEEAAKKWSEALRDDPNDVEVQVGLKISQEKVINDRLVKIRDLRIAKEHQQSLDELKKLIELQSEWTHKTDYNSASFQANETKALWDFMVEQLKLRLNKNQPLAAISYLNKYKEVFSYLKSADLQLELNKINLSGKKECFKNSTQSEGKAFFTSFSNQFCKFFDPGRKLSSVDSVSISSVLFSKINPKVSITGITPELANITSESLIKSFEESPLFNTDAKKVIPITITGKYIWSPSSTQIHQAHNYTVQIPYTDYVPVMKTKQVPYQTVEYRCVYNAYYGNTCGNVNTTAYRTDYYWVNEPVTKYRDEPRVHNYVATKKTQDIVLTVRGQYILDGETKSFEHTKHETDSVVVHNMNMPQIGLYPATKDLESPIERYKTLSQEIAAKFEEKAGNDWQNKYCSIPKERSIASIGENVMRCRKLPSSLQDSKFIDNWFNNAHGVSEEEAVNIIGEF